ncbi:hypothetical protein HIM_05910 [Hirsutella minnesotensis 3608]|uniref:AB hydrolase-1 domain-containing protein n=1 Tax=Hirsutella minnesotensis 3608 TaxID=1043627 RepID=A0A0F7ZUF9_9HYPO|nr:hypothetical protein HIM_05910 [Hirsutella minnesotensis 3608]
MFLEIGALKKLTDHVKSGDLPGGRHKNSKLILVGHSFGSVISLVLTNDHPEVSDGIILTGFTQATNFMPEFILGSDFVPSMESFEPIILQQSVKLGQPVTCGEILTMGPVSMKSRFKGPVFIVTGGESSYV